MFASDRKFASAEFGAAVAAAVASVSKATKQVIPMSARFALMGCAVLFGITAFAVPSHAGHGDFSANIFVGVPPLFAAPPPPPPVVVVPSPAPPVVVVAPPSVPVVALPPPRVGFVWVQGFWDWDGGRYVWREGHWEHERPGFVYTPAAWVQVGGGWHLTRGHWVRVNDGPHGPPGCPPGLAMQGRC